MAKNPEEWMRQAGYDMDTAEHLFEGERYFYTVFLCHLSLEKALKAIYQKKFNVIPSSTNNLPYLIEKVQLKLPDEFSDAVSALNRMRVFPYYPDDLQKLLNDYDKDKTSIILEKSKEALAWLRAMEK
ncbi:MAG: HEPN domain-containing protein [Candidatus Scalindua sp.]|nr:HEPN domain-containing protein [Candidatus Scalindua sp.]